MYDTTDYDTVTGMGPKGHSVFDYQNSTYTQPNTWNVLAEEANAATANSGTELETRAKNNCVHLGPPPVADPQNDDVLVIIFADESDFAYHGESGGENPTFNDTISSGTKKTEKQNPYKDSGSPYPETIPNYLRTHDIHDNRHVQPTPHYKQDILEFNERRAVYIAVNSKTYQCFMYPSEPTGGQANAHEALPLMALASIATGTASNGLWTTNTSPRKSGTYSANSPYPENGTRDKCAYSNLDEVETQNPYWDLTNHPIPPGNPNTTGSWGNLETKGWGVNTQVRPFTSQRFTDDILLFLGQGGTGCDGTQCILIRVIDYNEVAEVGYTVTINGVDIGATNSYGEILYTIPNNSGPITINDCYTFNPKGDCVQSLITLKLPSDFETVINVEEDMIVHKFAQEAMIKWIIYGCLQAKTPTDHNLLALLKKERFAETRKAKIRLSAIKIEEITQIMRGKSKWIKH